MQTPNDTFSVAHPLFQWMFQASRNWSNISSVVNVMIDHLGRLPHLGRDLSRNGIKLVDERGELIDNYDIIFKELFCAAARALAEKTKSNLTQVGILWDEILPTGTGGDTRRQQQRQQPSSRRSHPSDGSDDAIAVEKGEIQQSWVQELYRGSLMFLVRRVDSSREVTDLEAAGYRFAELHQVSGIISSSMQIKTDNFEARLANMASYAQQDSSRLSPGVHLGFFAVRARVGSQGFDILVRNSARHLLPSVEMTVGHLEPWQLNFLRQLDGFTPSRVVKALENRNNLSAQDFFASQLLTSLKHLRDEIEDDIFEEATLAAKVVQIPCRPGTSSSSSTNSASLIAFKLVIPIHYPVRCPGLEFVPLSLFKVHQLAYKDSPHNLIFSRSVHREISPILNTIPIIVHPKPTAAKPRVVGGLSLAPTRTQRFSAWFHRKPAPRRLPRTTVDADGNPIPTVYGRTESNHSSSTLKLWNPSSSSSNNQNHHHDGARRPEGERSNSWQDQGSDDNNTPKGSSTFDAVERYTGPTSSDLPTRMLSPQVVQQQQRQHDQFAAPSGGGGGGGGGAFGGIMVSQEITVNVADAADAPGLGAGELGRKVTRVGTGNRRPSASAGHQEKVEETTAIEMQPLGNKAGVTVQAESVAEATTFVDELFAVCVEWR